MTLQEIKVRRDELLKEMDNLVFQSEDREELLLLASVLLVQSRLMFTSILGVDKAKSRIQEVVDGITVKEKK